MSFTDSDETPNEQRLTRLALVRVTDELSNFEQAAEVYKDAFFGRNLDPGEIDDALAEASVMQSAAFGMMNSWVDALSEAHVESQVLTDEARIATDFMADGASILRRLRPSVTYALHLERQCTRLCDAKLLSREKLDASVEASQTLDAIAAAIERDVSMFEGRVSVLLMQQQSDMMVQQGRMMSIQTDLSARVTRLTRVTTILTVIILVATIFAGVVGGISAL